ncbi:GH92 family glycosyl hydrolase [Bacteroides uniformis]|mgnify:FL=1|uniref:GH92 family glycosyl hydrolase n=1 Tax=Bacteroides uniformis TaxID=820 RepID=UPI001B44E7B5|nr:GH92 family glycosyl hydrolase [Bacteroides sp.]
MKKVILLFLLYFSSSLWGQSRDVTEYVDSMIGNSDSRWMQFPGPAMPFGMVKLSPDNQGNVWRGGYEYKINQIIGFSHIHSWTMGGLLTMPVTGPLKIKPGEENEPDSGYRSRINHKNEKASLSYYSVLLDDYNIKAELTSTTRTGFQRYTFPKSDSSRILFDLENGSEYPYEVRWASISKVSDYEIEGFSTQSSYDEPTNLLNDYTVYFVARVDKPMKSFGTWVNGYVDTTSSICWGRHDIGAFMNFDTEEGEIIQLKTAISYVSIEQARKNLEVESGGFGWNFDAVRKYAVNEWRKILSTIEIEGGTEEDKRKFYTNLYRSYCSRTIFSDVDGQYVDMYERTQQLKDPASPIYGCDAFWNTFWNLNQLWALATPDIMNKWVESLLEYYRVGGWLPNGPPGVEYCDIMGAQHEIPLMVSAYQKGIRNYDVDKAYEAVKKTLTTQGTALSSGGIVGNRHLDVYLKYGFVPYGEKSHHNVFGTTYEGPTSNTLEYAFDDWNAAQFAKALGYEEDYDYFTRRAYNYKNVFDSETKYVRPKYSDGTWMPDFEPINKDEHSTSWSWLGSGFVEGNSWQYTWMVPHDMNELVKMIGREEFNRRLNEGFEISSEYSFSPPGDRFSAAYVNHGNQPCMQAAFLFNYSGKPWLTQYWAREMMNKYYGSTPIHGWPGDEDQGQGGAWFVMAAMGLFEVNGGGCVEPFYEISSPLFEKVTIHLDEKYYKGGKFVIEAKNVSNENRYIQSAKLNGKKLSKPWFYHSELVNGGKLELIMGKKPNYKWGSRPQDAPPSMSSNTQ